jgi:deaminated glutathione amidase
MTRIVACLQTPVRADMASALAVALEQAREAVARGARLLALPEYCGGLVSEGGMVAPPAAPEEAHPVLAGLRDFAAGAGVWLAVGSIAVADGAGRTLNRGYVIDAQGGIVSRYDKIHLFDIQLSPEETYRESGRITGGAQAVVVDTPFGRIGQTICYDLRFPQLHRALAQAGAEIILSAAAFLRKTGEAHWHVLSRARAIENGVYVLAPCAVGPVPGGGESYGHSLIVDPWGRVVADGGAAPGIVTAGIARSAGAEARARIPSLGHDRPFEVRVVPETATVPA